MGGELSPLSSMPCKRQHRKPIHEQSKTCKRCGAVYHRKTHNPQDWSKQMFCSKKCFLQGEAFKQRGMPQPRGENSVAWKGDAAKYQAIHIWVRQQRGKASNFVCVDCGKSADEWSNVDGKYRRILSDFIPRCRKCHRAFDQVTTKAWITKRKKYNYAKDEKAQRANGIR